MNLTSIPALQDNYIWTLNDNRGQCLLVDPGDAVPVMAVLQQNQWQPVAILLTHHHHDHTDGVAQLKEKWPQLDVYGPKETRQKGTTTVVIEGDTVSVLGNKFDVISTPGHTSGHISFYSSPYLFCGDTLFSAGCGRLFEGTAKQMLASLKKLNALPADTLICCAHEYTLSNLRFAQAIWPDNSEIMRHFLKIKALRAHNSNSLPSNLATERRINLFLMTQHNDLLQVLNLNAASYSELQVFAELRRLKDHF